MDTLHKGDNGDDDDDDNNINNNNNNYIAVCGGFVLEEVTDLS
jgi:hypothetical protein